MPALIQIQTSKVVLPAGAGLLKLWCIAALNAPISKRKPKEIRAQITLRFVGTTEGRSLNLNFRKKDYATNVLTFAYQTEPVIADLVFCTPVIRTEAREQRKNLTSHLAHMVVHGVLHARGMDHEVERDALIMERLEIKIMAELGYMNPYFEDLNEPTTK